MKNKLTWKKVGSVTTGGKPFFWICLIDNCKEYSVVWDRIDQKWCVTNSKGITLAQFDTDKKGKQYVETAESISDAVVQSPKFDYEAFRKFMDAPPNEPSPIGF